MRFLRRKDEKFLYGWTQTLADRTEFFECDSKGTPVETPVEPMPEPTPAPKMEKVADKPVSRMDDSELEAYARKQFNVELDRRLSIANLRKQVKGLTNGTLSEEDIQAGRTEPLPEVEEEPEAPAEVPTMPEEFSTKQDAIRWAKDNNLGISFRSRDSKKRAIERIEKALAELRGE